jgi:hypothetical protein
MAAFAAEVAASAGAGGPSAADVSPTTSPVVAEEPAEPSTLEATDLPTVLDQAIIAAQASQDHWQSAVLLEAKAHLLAESERHIQAVAYFFQASMAYRQSLCPVRAGYAELVAARVLAWRLDRTDDAVVILSDVLEKSCGLPAAEGASVLVADLSAELAAVGEAAARLAPVG